MTLRFGSEYVPVLPDEQMPEFVNWKGRWLTATVDQSIAWPLKPIAVQFRSHWVLLRPETDKEDPSVSIQVRNGLDSKSARQLILHFLSSLSWAERGSIKTLRWMEASYPSLMGCWRGKQVASMHFDVTYLPDPPETNVRAALALYRDGLSLQHIHPPYSFLSYYRVIEACLGRHQGMGR